MQRKIEHRDGKTFLVTSNGTTTTSATTYLRELKDYTPLDNGFNLELANDILSTIEHNKALWEQGVWRRFFTITENADHQMVFDVDADWWGEKGHDPALTAEQARAAASFEQDQDAPTCGTAMCFAGWAGELSGAAPVIDTATWLDLSKSYHVLDGPYAEQVVVPRRQWDRWTKRSSGYRPSISTFEYINEPVKDALRARGFTSVTHGVVTMAAYAEMALGLTHGDYLGLFDGFNGLVTIRSIIDAYAKHGPACSMTAWEEVQGGEAPGGNYDPCEPCLESGKVVL